MKKIFCLWLSLLMMASCVSCSESTKDNAETGTDAANNAAVPASDSIADVQPEETAYKYYEHLPEMHLDGMEFRIISRKTAEGHDVQSFTDYGNNEIDAAEMDGTQINDAVFVRNRELEKRYGFSFNSIQINNTPMATVKTSVLASSDDYDLVADVPLEMKDYSFLYKLDNLEHLDLAAPCWDQNIRKSLSIGGKHYLAVGDLLILDKKGTWCMLFNKKLAADLQLENMYDLVREGRWTMDDFYEKAKLFAGDLNGDGKQTEEDNWGFLTEGYNTNILMFAGETRFSEKDAEDYPVLTNYDDRVIAVFEKVFNIMTDKNVSLSMNWSKNGPADCLKAFSEDRGLFYMTGIGTAMEYRYMDSDFGILPIPKYDEAQDTYYTSISIYNSGCIGVPKSVLQPEKIGFLTQALCMASTNTLKPTFYDTVLNGVTVRDTESRDMLDIIFENRVYDLAFIQNWGGIGDIYVSLVGVEKNSLASAVQRHMKVASRVMEKSIEEYMKLD